MKTRDWETDEVRMARANVQACAYNAMVNYGSEREAKKMGDLVRAINSMLRIEGRAKLQYLKDKGIIDGWEPCATECEVRPGGQFHAAGCENDLNHPVYRERGRRAGVKLTDEEGGWHVASLSLVGA